MSEGPVPVPTPETVPFWEGTAAGELRVPRCRSCGKHHFYPRPFCPHCHSDEIEWTTATGKAALASYAINYRPAPFFKTDQPQVIALVDLDEGVRMMTNVVGVEPLPENLPLGLRLRVVFEPRGDQFLPLFTPDERS